MLEESMEREARHHRRRGPLNDSCLGRLILVLPMEGGNEVGIKEEAGRDP